MKNFLALIVCCLCLGMCKDSVAQYPSKVDSLLKLLTTAKEDTNKAKYLSSLSKYFSRREPDKALEYATRSLALSQKLGYKKGIILSYQNLAAYHYYRNEYDTSLAYSKKALPIIAETHNKRALADAYSNLSTLSCSMGKYDTSIEYSNKALVLANEMKNQSLIATIYGNRGLIYLDFSDYATSLDYFFKSLKINEGLKDKSAMADNYFSIGHVYWMQRNNDSMALKYFNLSLKAAEESDDQLRTAEVLNMIGEYYHDKNDKEKALDYYRQALSLSTELGKKSGISSCNRNIGSIYCEEGKFDEAIKYTSRALEISEEIGDKISIGNAHGRFGEIYLKMKDYKKAVESFKKSLAFARETGQKNNEGTSLMSLGETYELMKDFKTSTAYFKEYVSVKDTLLTEETLRKNAELEARFSLQKKEKEIALLTKDKEMQALEITFLKNSVVGGILVLVLLLFLGYRIYHTRQLLKLQTLRNKIASDLHDDIGSTLGSISMFSQMARQQSKEVLPMLDQIGEYSRKMLESMADIVWTINPENDNFEKIILRMRSFAFELLGAKNIDFEFNADESISNVKLSMEVRKNLYLIFKEATNNMVKYANADSAMFSLTGSKNMLTMLIRDNGKGFDVNSKTQGNGLKNMKNRALEIGAKFLIESEPGKGTTIQLLIKTA